MPKELGMNWALLPLSPLNTLPLYYGLFQYFDDNKEDLDDYRNDVEEILEEICHPTRDNYNDQVQEQGNRLIHFEFMIQKMLITKPSFMFNFALY